MQKTSKKFLSKSWAIDIILQFLIASLTSLRCPNVPLLLSFIGVFGHKSNSTELIIFSCTSKSDLFLTRFKFVSYLEKAVRKKDVKNMREAN